VEEVYQAVVLRVGQCSGQCAAVLWLMEGICWGFFGGIAVSNVLGDVPQSHG
jgi:hypothetical protein